MTAPQAQARVAALNYTRAQYGEGPIKPEDEQSALEDVACDDIAEDWIRSIGSQALFAEKWNELVALFDCDVSYRLGRIDRCGIVDQWECVHGLSREDFTRLRKNIEIWLSYHSGMYGRRD